MNMNLQQYMGLKLAPAMFFVRGDLCLVFQAKISLVVSWNYVFSCFKLVELFGKIKPPIINIDSGTKYFGATFVLKLISCSKIITVFNS